MNQITKILIQDINSGKENFVSQEMPTKCISNKKILHHKKQWFKWFGFCKMIMGVVQWLYTFSFTCHYVLKMTKMHYNFLEIIYLTFFRSWSFHPSEMSQRLREWVKDQRKAEKEMLCADQLFFILYILPHK